MLVKLTILIAIPLTLSLAAPIDQLLTNFNFNQNTQNNGIGYYYTTTTTTGQQEVTKGQQSTTMVDIPFITVPQLDFKNIPRIKYDDLEQNNAKTGDLLLFSGEDALGQLLRRFTVSPYGHAGMVYRTPEHGLAVFHSNVVPQFDVIRAERTNGTQVNAFSFLRDTYTDGHVVWRRLNVSDEERQKLQQSMDKTVQEWSGYPFPSFVSIPLNYIRGKLGWPVDRPVNINHRFCTELIVETYQRAGILKVENVVPSAYAPGDLSDRRRKLEHDLLSSSSSSSSTSTSTSSVKWMEDTLVTFPPANSLIAIENSKLVVQ